MPRAYVNIEDVDGQVAVNFVFPGGFRNDSPAHQTCNIIKKHLDDMMQELAPMTHSTMRLDGSALVTPLPTSRLVVP